MKMPLPSLALVVLLALVSVTQPLSSLAAQDAHNGAAIPGTLPALAGSAGPSADGVNGTPTAPTFDGTSWWNYVKVLAADDMEGRETGSPGLRRAQEYVVDQLKHAGLEPAGSKGYYQPVQFVSRQIVEMDSSLALVRDGQTESLALGDDAIFSTRVDLAQSLEAPLAFAGYGLTVPENGYDDLAGLDLRGKVAVVFSGAPEEIPGALASHYQ